MIASERQTAPPPYEVALVTFPVCARPLEAPRGFDLLCFARMLPRFASGGSCFRADVSLHLATGFVAAPLPHPLTRPHHRYATA